MINQLQVPTRQPRLNAICPYFTMFPLDFPLRLLARRARPGDRVLDPFCGRGTTTFAARVLGLPSVGIDSSSVAAAISRSKMEATTAAQVVRAAQRILDDESNSPDIPKGMFWRLAFSSRTLHDICKVREALMRDCRSPARAALRGIMLGALHGPLNVGEPSYFSNQAPRTFAPKPRYAIGFWSRRGLRPPGVRVLDVVRKRATWYLADALPTADNTIVCGDAREPDSFRDVDRVDWIVTSPPYYGLRTYVQDQWLRDWFVGASDEIDYRQQSGQLQHDSPESFAAQLRDVWRACAAVSNSSARLVCRFGGIHDRRADPVDVCMQSFQDSGWKIVTRRDAGAATDGKRQSDQFARGIGRSRQEFDVYAVTG